MPDAPTGSYIGSYGLPVATGEIKIGLSAWDADLEQDSYLSAEALDSAGESEHCCQPEQGRTACDKIRCGNRAAA